MPIKLYIFTVLLWCIQLTELRTVKKLRNQDISKVITSLDSPQQQYLFSTPGYFTTAAHQVNMLDSIRTIIYKLKESFKGQLLRKMDRRKRATEQQSDNTKFTDMHTDNYTINGYRLLVERNDAQNISYPTATSYTALKNKPEVGQSCANGSSCLHPYVSYFAGIMMFFLLVYLIITIGRCVCGGKY